METNNKTKIKIRRGENDDLEGIYECHKKCFEQSDLWYKSIIQQSLKNSYIVEKLDSEKTIIGILLQGDVIACDPSEIDSYVEKNKSGEIFKNNNLHIEPINGVTMICIDPEFRNKGLASRLLKIHFEENENKIVGLLTRKSNPAYNLYLKMGYEHIADIKDKYFFPIEDAYLLIKNN